MNAAYKLTNNESINDIFIAYHQINERKISQFVGDIYQLKEILDNDLFYIDNNLHKNQFSKQTEKTIKENLNRQLQEKSQSLFADKRNNNIKNENNKLINSKASVNEITNEPLYKIFSDDTSLIKLPSNYETTDLDLKSIIDLMNEPLDNKVYTEIVIKETCKIYKKQIAGCHIDLIRSLYKVPYPKDVIVEAIANIDLRKKWDDTFIELKIVGKNESNGADILYLSVKSPSIVLTPRDFVQQRKIWRNFPNDNSCLFHFRSIDYPSCPLIPKLIRGETIISGFYIQDDLTRPGHSILGIISHTDIKGNIPTWLVNTVTPKASINWIENLSKGCKMVLSMKI